MARELTLEPSSHCLRTQRALQRAILAFFGTMVALLIVLYLVAPSLYVEALMLEVPANDAHPLAVNLFFVAIVAFVTALCVGVARRWRWLFWLVLLAFLIAPLEIPAGILQLLNIIPIRQPAWYTLLRMAISLVELALGVWMLRTWRRCGIWAEGRAQ